MNDGRNDRGRHTGRRRRTPAQGALGVARAGFVARALVVGFALAAAQGANGGTETGYAPRIQDLQAVAHLSNGLLGLALAGWSIGMITSALRIGRLCDRFGTRLPYLVGCCLYWAPFLALGHITNGFEYFGCLLGVGLGNGGVDIPLGIMSNAHDRERTAWALAHGRPAPGQQNVLWGAGYSVLSGVAAFVGSDARAHHVPVSLHLAVLALIGLALTVPFVLVLPDVRGEVSDIAAETPSRRQIRHGRQQRHLQVVGAAAGLVIGAVYAWSIKYTSALGASPIVAGYGLELFAAGQGIFQIVTYLVAKPGRLPRWLVVTGGGAIASAGGVLVIVAPGVIVAIAGFALIGAGLAAIFQLVSSEADAIAVDTSRGHAIGRVTLAGYGGLVVAQPVMGVLAQFVGLRLAWLLIIPCAGVVVVFGPTAFERRRQPAAPTPPPPTDGGPNMIS